MMDMVSTPKITLNKNSISFNQVRLAAVSNYKLAQLTFAPPDNCSLRKTALIKNLVEIIYVRTPSEWLTHMTRWKYFTPESLEDMTQKDIEKIIYRYSQFIYTSSINVEKYTKDQKFLFVDYDMQILKEQEQQQKAEDEVHSYYTALFSHPNSVFSNESLSSFEEDCFKQPLQANEEESNVNSDSDKDYIEDSYTPARPFSQHSNNNGGSSRLSWLSDTGVPTNSAIAQNLATELMTLFDMEFNVNLSLPELKKSENVNGSTTTLNRVFSAEQDDDDNEEDDDYFDNKNVIQVVQPSNPFVDHNTRLQYKLSPPPPPQSNPPSSSVLPPLTPPPHDNNRNQMYNPTLPVVTPPHDKKKQPYQYYYSSSSDEEEEDDDDTNSDSDASSIVHRARKITLSPNRTTSLEYRRSLQARFELSEDESSETSSSFFNDSLSTVELEMNYIANNNRHTRNSSTPTFEGFLHALSNIKSPSSSRRNSVASNYNIQAAKKTSSQSVVSPSIDNFSHDNFSIKSSSSKRKNLIQKIVNFVIGGGRGSTASSLSRTTTLELPSPSNISIARRTTSPSTTVVSRSSILSDATSYHQRPITPRSAKRHGIYTTSMISDTSSFNWAEETRKRSNTVDETTFTTHSNFSKDTQGTNNFSNKTLPNIPQNHDMSTSTGEKQRPKSSAMSFLKRLASFKKDKKQRKA